MDKNIFLSKFFLDNIGFFKKFATAFFVLFMFFCFEHSKAQNKRPNIIFICTDDQADWTLGVSGNTQAYTPNLDHLAKEGAYLRNTFVTTPVCSPSRSSIFSGQYSSETKILDFIVPPGHKAYTPEEGLIGLENHHSTFADLLHNAGYKTALVGKWHLGDWLKDSTRKYHPLKYGFDYFMGLTGGGTRAKNGDLEENGVVGKYPELTEDVLTDRAIKFIQSSKDKPFLLCLMYRAPHGPWLPVAPEDASPYKNLDPKLPNPDYPNLDTERVKRMMKEYLESVTAVDRNVGNILAALKEMGISENTIIIFTSDNGYNMGHNGIHHKGNGIWVTKPFPKSSAPGIIPAMWRPNLYDNSLRVPGIVYWPGVTKGGEDITHTVSNVDWYPTIIQMAGVSVPKNVVLRGNSIVPLLKRDKNVKWDDDFYSEYSMIHYATALMRSYRTPKWKLVKDFLNPQRNELYDLKNDPEEHNNLFASKGSKIQSIIKDLDVKLKERMREINDPLLKATEDKNLTNYPYKLKN